MLALWDTTGREVVHKLSAERRTAGGLASGLALTLVVLADEPQVRAVEDAVTIAAAAHPCRLIVVTRDPAGRRDGADRLDAQITVGGRLGPVEAVMLRMQGRLALHAESVVVPLLAPDVPVVTWWHGPPPERIAHDPLGVVADRRITDVAQAGDPPAALRQRAVDYAAGDTDLAWTRITPWRALLASALDTLPGAVTAATVTAGPGDARALLLAGWLAARLGVTPTLAPADGPDRLQSVELTVADAGSLALRDMGGAVVLSRPGQPDRVLPLLHRQLGDELAEDLRRLDTDQPYAAALGAATGVADLRGRPQRRVHVWHDPAPAGR